MVRSPCSGKRRSEERDFRDRVFRFATKLFPDTSFRLPVDKPDVIVAGRWEIGLQNLRRKFDQSDKKESSLRALVEKHLAFVLADDRSSCPALAEALPRLRPQIMPPDYAESVPIVCFPFGKSLAVGIVLDDEKGYVSVKREDVAQWQGDPRSLFDRAVNNLDRASCDLSVEVRKGKEAAFIGIAKNDGYDAARILIPRLRSFIAEHIGSPFRFGIPNRDFLVCWNSGAPDRFNRWMKKKLTEDFRKQPYPLSPNIFAVDSEGNITEHLAGLDEPSGAASARAASHRQGRRSRGGVRRR